jgi:hypothetical protein
VGAGAGPGVYEAAIEYAEALEAADRATLFKLAAKELAMPHGIMPSFMGAHRETRETVRVRERERGRETVCLPATVYMLTCDCVLV